MSYPHRRRFYRAERIAQGHLTREQFVWFRRWYRRQARLQEFDDDAHVRLFRRDGEIVVIGVMAAMDAIPAPAALTSFCEKTLRSFFIKKCNTITTH